jgi:hypothetical protein
MDEILKKYQDQLDQAIKLSEKINRQKSYLVDLLIKDTSQASGVIINKYLDWLEEDEKVKPELEPKEYYDEDTFDIQYLYLYNDSKNGVMRFRPTLLIEPLDWVYMGKVRLEK